MKKHKFPTSYEWLLFVDLKKHHFDELRMKFESRENGYFKAIIQAFDFAKREIKDTEEGLLTVQFIKKIHRLALDSVSNIDSVVSRGDFMSDTRVSHYNISKRGFDSPSDLLFYATEEGLTEWLQIHNATFSNCTFRPIDRERELTITKKEDLISAFNSNNLKIVNFPKDVLADVEKILEKYNQGLPYKSKDDAIHAICALVQSLERRHPFLDGNGRICSMVLLNVLLAKHGFMYALQADPNRVDGLSLPQLVKEILYSIRKSAIFCEKFETDPGKAVKYLKLASAFDRLVFKSPGTTPTTQILDVLMRIVEKGQDDTLLKRLETDISLCKALLVLSWYEIKIDENIIKVFTENSDLRNKISANHKHGKNAFIRNRVTRIMSKEIPCDASYASHSHANLSARTSLFTTDTDEKEKESTITTEKIRRSKVH